MKEGRKDFNSCLVDLQRRISEGDEHAFEEIYSYYHKKLTAFSKNFLRSTELAEEVVEDVFVKLWSKREDIIDINNLTTYLYSATKNRSLNALSQEARRLVTESLEISDSEMKAESYTPHDLLVTSEMMQLMQQTLDLLPKRCKLIFRLIREDGLKYKEVAEILNISVNTIDAQMAIAVKRLCAALSVDKSKRARVHLPE